MKANQKINLLPKGKVQHWLVSYHSDDMGGNIMEECDSKEEVFMLLVSLEADTDMNTVVVYPPNSNLTFEEFMAK